MLKNYILPLCHYWIETINNNSKKMQASINHETYMPSFPHIIIFSLRDNTTIVQNNPHQILLKSPMTALPLYQYAL